MSLLLTVITVPIKDVVYPMDFDGGLPQDFTIEITDEVFASLTSIVKSCGRPPSKPLRQTT